MPPKRNTLSRDQLEVHAACFGESPPGSPTSGLASQGVIEKDLYVLPDGSTIDLTDTIQRAVNKRLSHVSPASDVLESSFVGFTNQGDHSNPSHVGLQEQSTVNQQPPQLYAMSEDSDSEQDSDDESEDDEFDIEDVFGVGVNSLTKVREASKVIIPQKVGFINSLNDPPLLT